MDDLYGYIRNRIWKIKIFKPSSNYRVTMDEYENICEAKCYNHSSCQSNTCTPKKKVDGSVRWQWQWNLADLAYEHCHCSILELCSKMSAMELLHIVATKIMCKYGFIISCGIAAVIFLFMACMWNQSIICCLLYIIKNYY